MPGGGTLTICLFSDSLLPDVSPEPAGNFNKEGRLQREAEAESDRGDGV